MFVKTLFHHHDRYYRHVTVDTFNGYKSLIPMVPFPPLPRLISANPTAVPCTCQTLFPQGQESNYILGRLLMLSTLGIAMWLDPMGMSHSVLHSAPLHKYGWLSQLEHGRTDQRMPPPTKRWHSPQNSCTVNGPLILFLTTEPSFITFWSFNM